MEEGREGRKETGSGQEVMGEGLVKGRERVEGGREGAGAMGGKLMLGIKIVKTVAIDLLPSINPS
ncbi:hypothetical protein E2C01_077798 [Portunus trituberculatus]|uniref:Uncharacterized protein n=1 Tax=Portunus trituberculatus TaxID=210409 RepID=A0A5B7IMZ2_PORTR|nr:hypothetical protein [Portunus trituberculatus]